MIKAVYGSPTKAAALLLSADCSTLPTETIAVLDLPPFFHETIRAVQQLSSRKVPGSEVMPAKIFESLRHGKSRRAVENRAGIRPSRTIHADGVFASRRHDGAITDHRAASEAFAVNNGVKQSCALAPTLFTLIFSAMLFHAYRDERPRIPNTYRAGSHLPNQWWMNFQSHLFTATVHELLFADGSALNATSEGDTQRGHGTLRRHLRQLRPTYQHGGYTSTANGRCLLRTPINVSGAQLQVVDIATYLGSTFSPTTKIDDEVVRRPPKPSKSSAIYKAQSGIATVATSTPNWGFTRPSSCRRCYIEQRPGRRT
ncbi:hypothetical protein SprV_0602234900 [Sparganum proliferum]